MLEQDGNAHRELREEDFGQDGQLKTLEADLALVVGSAVKVEGWLSSKQWNLLWRDEDLLFQSPRPMSVYENTYILEPNVQRFTVAKVVNAIVPQLYKGLFYDNPPMVLRPRPNTSQAVTDGKTALFASLLDEIKFKQEVKWGLEELVFHGTGIWKWGIDYKEVRTPKRKVQSIKAPSAGVTGEEEVNYTDELPVITYETKTVARPFIEHRHISNVWIDPQLEVSDIREARYVIDVRYADKYEMESLEKVVKDSGDKGWHFDGLQDIWNPPTQAKAETPTNTVDEVSKVSGVVHHAESPQTDTSVDPHRRKVEILEYWDKSKKIVVIGRKKVLYSGENPFQQIPFLSANWWNRPKAFYGMGLGIIVGQNQRVDQGAINAILKMLSFGVNPLYLRKRDSNNPTQMIRTAIGKILQVDGNVEEAYKLMETPKVPSDVWTALRESQQATESTSGADQTLVQGSTAGPRTSMGRTAGGAGILASASATRLDGPLDNFIEQVFKPFLYIVDMLIYMYLSDKDILDVIGKELGKDYEVDMQEFHNAVHEYEVLAGASLAAKRIMAQSMTLITQIFQQPQIQENLAEINGEYIDFKPILNMWMEASEWKNRQDIIKPLTPEMLQRRQQQSQAAMAAQQANSKQTLEQQKFEQKQQLDDQATDNRIKRDIVREAFRNSAMSEAVAGLPSAGGLGGEEPTVE